MKLIVFLADLEITTSHENKIKELLEEAANKQITFIPLEMETYNQVYYRDKQIDTFKGFRYYSNFDDKRGLRNFIGDCFEQIKKVLPGHSEVSIISSPDYFSESQLLEKLIKGQQLKQTVTLEKWELA